MSTTTDHPHRTGSIAQVDYMTDGTPCGTVVMVTMKDGTKVDLVDAASKMFEEGHAPMIHICLVSGAVFTPRAVAA